MEQHPRKQIFKKSNRPGDISLQQLTLFVENLFISKRRSWNRFPHKCDNVFVLYRLYYPHVSVFHWRKAIDNVCQLDCNDADGFSSGKSYDKNNGKFSVHADEFRKLYNDIHHHY